MTADPELRASDAERRRVAESLRTHYLDGRLTQDDFDQRVERALAARTQGELVELTRDLPQEAPAPAEPLRQQRKVSVHVIGGFAREERGVAQDEYLFVTGLGGLDLDLSGAQIPARGVDIKVWSVIGGVVLTVPDGVSVEHSGFSLLGGVDDTTHGAAGSPSVRLAFYSLIGGVAVEPPGGPRRPRLSRRRHRGLPPPPPPP